MAFNPKVNSLGWSTGDDLTPAQMNALDDQQAKALIIGDGFPEIDPQVVTNWVPPCSVAYGTGFATGAVDCHTQSVIDSELRFWLFLPIGAVINACRIHVVGSVGYSSLASVTLPTMRLEYVTLATGAVTNVSGPVTDPSASLGAYQAHHQIQINGLSHTVAAGRRYQVRYHGDLGGGWLAGTQVFMPMLDVTIDRLRAT